MPRKTDSSNPADWLYICERDPEGLRSLARQEVSYELCKSKLAEVIEKGIKAELIRAGWALRKTHDLIELGQEIAGRSPEMLAQVKPLCDDFAHSYRVDRYPGFGLADEDWPALRAHVDAVGELLALIKQRIGPERMNA